MEERAIERVNNLTNELHDTITEINEALIDRDNESTIKIINSLQKRLKEIKRDLSNETF